MWTLHERKRGWNLNIGIAMLEKGRIDWYYSECLEAEQNLTWIGKCNLRHIELLRTCNENGWGQQGRDGWKMNGNIKRGRSRTGSVKGEFHFLSVPPYTLNNIIEPRTMFSTYLCCVTKKKLQHSISRQLIPKGDAASGSGQVADQFASAQSRGTITCKTCTWRLADTAHFSARLSKHIFRLEQGRISMHSTTRGRLL